MRFALKPFTLSSAVIRFFRSSGVRPSTPKLFRAERPDHHAVFAANELEACEQLSRDMRAAPIHHASNSNGALRHDAALRPEISRGNLLRHLHVQKKIRNQLLQPTLLVSNVRSRLI